VEIDLAHKKEVAAKCTLLRKQGVSVNVAEHKNPGLIKVWFDSQEVLETHRHNFEFDRNSSVQLPERESFEPPFESVPEEESKISSAPESAVRDVSSV
jgi:hypothetical protein